jgi:hypothetical protein
MRNILFAALGSAMLLSAGTLPSLGADLSVSGPYVGKRVVGLDRTCRAVRRCGPDGCHIRHVCWGGCTDRYSCYPLYGAYGPYGGTAYWSQFTASGWGYR